MLAWGILGEGAAWSNLKRENNRRKQDEVYFIKRIRSGKDRERKENNDNDLETPYGVLDVSVG
jgi:hypothetical protein